MSATGDAVTVTFAETGPTTMRIAATFSRGSLINASYVLALPDFAANVTSQLDAAILVNNAPGVDPDRAKADIEAALADYPNVTVNSPEDITEKAQNSVNQLLGIVTALLLLAVVVAVLGIVNTLVLSVVERTRELGLLRAVGGTRRQVRTVVRRESVLMSLLGAVTGIALGTLSGVALSRALVDEGITTIAIPTLTLAVYLSSQRRWACLPPSVQRGGRAGWTSCAPSRPSSRGEHVPVAHRGSFIPRSAANRHSAAGNPGAGSVVNRFPRGAPIDVRHGPDGPALVDDRAGGRRPARRRLPGLPCASAAPRQRSVSPPIDVPVQLLRHHLANGEIDDEDYRRRRSALGD